VSNLRLGQSKSCGCLNRERVRQQSVAVAEGEAFGRWTVLHEIARGAGGERRLLCRCECGRRKPVYLHNLRSGISTGCQGCVARRTFTTHGESRSVEYKTWRAMKARCHPTKGHPRYGPRGIRVCARWLGDGGFERFLADVGRRPSGKHSIGRIDNDGHYEPGNVRWETAAQQNRNKCTNTLEVHGRRVTMQDVADRHGISRQAIDQRLRHGWTPEECWDHGRGDKPPRLTRGYTCSLCGETNHNRRTCPERSAAAAA